MYFEHYFQAYEHYFWRWGEQGAVVTLSKGNTIAYRDFVFEILNDLQPQGLPPFGSLLMVLAATNEEGLHNVEHIRSTIAQLSPSFQLEGFPLAYRLLELLAKLPGEYRTGQKRLVLIQGLFENAHKLTSARKSKRVIEHFNKLSLGSQYFHHYTIIEKTYYRRDFSVLELLGRKYKNAEDIIKKVNALLEIDDEIELGAKEPEAPKDFLETLLGDHRTFHVGALIKSIWSGLDIPFHNVLPSQQPLGGVADISNKGDFDRLLISEFANDDITMMSRLANNEALYLQREVPPTDNRYERVMLLDTSLKTWGVPKTVGFAVMLAIAKHPKSNFDYSLYALGNEYHKLEIETLEQVVDGLNIVEACLSPARAMERYFIENPVNTRQQIIFISSKESLLTPALQGVLSDKKEHIQFRIAVDEEANVSVHKNRGKAMRHIQDFSLDLKRLWKEPKPRRKSKLLKRKDENITLRQDGFYTLFDCRQPVRTTLTAPDGEIFVVNESGYLLKLHDSTSQKLRTGWELMRPEKFRPSAYAIGQNEAGDYIFLYPNHYSKTKRLELYNLTTGDMKSTDFTYWDGFNHLGAKNNPFIFQNGLFHYGQYPNVAINPEGEITNTNVNVDASSFEKKEPKYPGGGYPYQFLGGHMINNFKRIGISSNGDLVFNDIHFLKLDDYGMVLDTQYMKTPIEAIYKGNNTFEFLDGSSIVVHRAGAVRCISANESIPAFTFPTVKEKPLAASTGEEAAGNSAYIQMAKHQGVLETVNENPLDVIRELKSATGRGLADCKGMVDLAPSSIGLIDHSIIGSLSNQLDSLGATVSFRPYSQYGLEQGPAIVSTEQFWRKYIQPFIEHIGNHAS